MKILLLTKIIPKEQESITRNKMINTLDEASIHFQNKLIKGLSKVDNSDLFAINILPVRSFPKYYKSVYINSFRFKINDRVNGVNVNFFNIPVIKRLSQRFSLMRFVKKEYKNFDSIIVYGVFPEFMKALAYCKKRGKKTCLIVPDLPEYSILTKTRSIMNNLYLYWNKSNSYRYVKFVENFVLFSTHMNEKINPYSRKNLVVEGLSLENIPKITPAMKRITYAGTLHEKFGILKLLDCFDRIKDLDYSLHIFGIGDSQDDVIQASNKDSRIHYYGIKPIEEVHNAISYSCLVVNPRKSGEEFEKFSFPSKNLEVMSIGIPLIAYKLGGIPDIYDNFINYPEDDSTESLLKLVIDVCEKNISYYQERALIAQKYVINNNNPYAVSARIIDLINREV